MAASGAGGVGRVRPGDEIRLVKENLAFAVAFWKAAAAGSVPPEPLLRPAAGPLPFNQPAGGPRPDAELSAELTRGAANQMRAAFALSALQAHRSLARAFPGEPVAEELPELRSARCAVRLIGQAVRGSILQPVWECPPAYRRLFQVRRLGFVLNAVGLDGRPLTWDDFGGLDCYLALLEYCAASADAAPEPGAERPPAILPTRLSQLDYDGIIAAPPSDDDHPPAGIPAGYPGDDAPPGDVAAATSPTPVTPSATPPNPTRNPIDRFVSQCCERGTEKRILAGELYAGYQDWCRAHGQEPASQRAFGMRLTALGLTRKRRGHGKHWWLGVALGGG